MVEAQDEFWVPGLASPALLSCGPPYYVLGLSRCPFCRSTRSFPGVPDAARDNLLGLGACCRFLALHGAQSFAYRRTPGDEPHAFAKSLAVPGRLTRIAVCRMDRSPMPAQANFSRRHRRIPPAPAAGLRCIAFLRCFTHGSPSESSVPQRNPVEQLVPCPCAPSRPPIISSRATPFNSIRIHRNATLKIINDCAPHRGAYRCVREGRASRMAQSEESTRLQAETQAA